MTQYIGEYAQLPVIGIAGESVDGHDASDFIFKINAGDKAVQTVATATVAGTIGTETFTSTIVLNLPENPALSVLVSTTAGGAITTATHVAADQVAKLNANTSFSKIAVASNALGVISIAVRANQYGRNPITSIANTASGSATYTAAPALTGFTTGSSVPYGYAVGQATTDSDGEARLWKGTGRILGIAALLRTNEQAYAPATNSFTGISILGSDVDSIPAGGQLKIKRKGRIYVVTADAVTRNAAVYASNTTGQIQATSSGATAISGATFETSTTAAGQIAIVQL
jgi:hypothetical protein